mmetsp:Transcript_4339/g.9368  ORF Transcript_4339/g.9368 Transcript_4339/m.9368 type:complete len:105 (+) Transcript_4339:31-345(+)
MGAAACRQGRVTFIREGPLEVILKPTQPDPRPVISRHVSASATPPTGVARAPPRSQDYSELGSTAAPQSSMSDSDTSREDDDGPAEAKGRRRGGRCGARACRGA